MYLSCSRGSSKVSFNPSFLLFKMLHSGPQILEVSKTCPIQHGLFEIGWDRQTEKASRGLLLDSLHHRSTIPPVSLGSFADRGLCTICLLSSRCLVDFGSHFQPIVSLENLSIILTAPDIAWLFLTVTAKIRSLSSSSSGSSWHNKSNQSNNWKEHKPEPLWGQVGSFRPFVMPYLFLLLFWFH